MNLFQIKPYLHGINRMPEFLRDNYVSVDGKEESELNIFVDSVQDGDYILVPQDEWVYLGDIGDYFYVDPLEGSEENGVCHRRGVTWLQCISRAELNPFVQELLEDPLSIKKFSYPYEMAQLERWARSQPQEITKGSDDQVKVDRDTMEEALAILKEAMRSEDADRRERAAIAILQFAK